jgi:hypothetical protein
MGLEVNCDLCGANFVRSEELALHLLKEHQINELYLTHWKRYPYKCYSCESPFPKYQLLCDHCHTAHHTEIDERIEIQEISTEDPLLEVITKQDEIYEEELLPNIDSCDQEANADSIEAIPPIDPELRIKIQRKMKINFTKLATNDVDTRIRAAKRLVAMVEEGYGEIFLEQDGVQKMIDAFWYEKSSLISSLLKCFTLLTQHGHTEFLSNDSAMYWIKDSMTTSYEFQDNDLIYSLIKEIMKTDAINTFIKEGGMWKFSEMYEMFGCDEETRFRIEELVDEIVELPQLFRKEKKLAEEVMYWMMDFIGTSMCSCGAEYSWDEFDEFENIDECPSCAPEIYPDYFDDDEDIDEDDDDD